MPSDPPTGGSSSSKQQQQQQQPPSSSASALHQLLAPDGYYAYLGIDRPPPPSTLYSSALFREANKDKDSPGAEENGIDEDKVKRNYRRLSLLHHPDRRSGDAETFRVLNRAKKVLTTPKLRKEYDLLGLDLDDDDDEHAHDEPPTSPSSSSTADGDGSGNGDDDGSSDKKRDESKSEASTVMGHISSAVLASLFQMIVRTIMMGTVASFLSRYRITVGLIGLFIVYVIVTLRNRNSAGKKEMLALTMLSIGVILMYLGGSGSGSWTFWLGETLTMTVFLVNSFALTNPPAIMGVAVFSSIACLILKGKPWRYVTLTLVQVGLAILALLIFPVLEMILEEIMNEKLRKVGEKIRAHGRRMEAEDERRRRTAAGGGGGAGGG